MIHIFPRTLGRRRHRCGPPAAPAPSRAVSKASAAVAVAEGHLSAGEACRLMNMDRHELEVWTHVVKDHGLRRMFAGRF